ncbi:MAG: hypothetical protein ABSG94_04865 [Brevinematales bacterium]|jgi:hypothetical protein
MESKISIKKTVQKVKTAAKNPVKKGAAKAGLKVTWEDIKKRAHEIYLERQEKGLPGDETSDWLAAENYLAGNV